jgi:hypothetical protein
VFGDTTTGLSIGALFGRKKPAQAQSTEAVWELVDSSNLRAVRWSDNGSIHVAHNTLDIMFHDGRTYTYFGVPETVYRALLAAPSKGKYHHQFIKYGYSYKQAG